MNLLDIQNRLRQLNAQKYLNDDETEEKEQLLDELAILRGDARKPSVKVQPIQKPQREHTVIGKAIISIIHRFKPLPATIEEIRQLKLESIKYKLKADVEHSKAKIKGYKGDRFGSLISGSSPKRKSTSKRQSSGGDYENDVGKVLRGAVKTKGAKFFSDGGSSKDIKKAFYG